MYEQITLVGNLGADPEMRFTPDGKPVTNFSVAVNARWTNSEGEPQERVTWYRVACWGRLPSNRRLPVTQPVPGQRAQGDGGGQPHRGRSLSRP